MSPVFCSCYHCDYLHKFPLLSSFRSRFEGNRSSEEERECVVGCVVGIHAPLKLSMSIGSADSAPHDELADVEKPEEDDEDRLLRKQTGGRDISVFEFDRATEPAGDSGEDKGDGVGDAHASDEKTNLGGND